MISPGTTTGTATTIGFWLGTTFLDGEYIFDGNLGSVKDFNLQTKNLTVNKDYWLQVN